MKRQIAIFAILLLIIAAIFAVCILASYYAPTISIASFSLFIGGCAAMYLLWFLWTLAGVFSR